MKQPQVYESPDFGGDPKCLDAQIYHVWQAYRKSRSKKEKKELRAKYERLVDEDTKQVGWKRYCKQLN
jgi:hypothetical protein